MKKLFFIALAVAGFTSVKAQSRVQLSDVMISSVRLTDGSNTVQIPEGRGTLKFVKRGETFSDVVFTDAAGKQTRLAPNNGSTGNAPKPECKYPIPSACYGIPNSQNIGMCICRPTDISNGSYNISLLLPAVQAAREAARRSQP